MATFEGAPWKMTYTAQQLQNAAANQVPFIGSNNNWWRWNIATQKYEDTGIVAHAGTLELLDGSVTPAKLSNGATALISKGGRLKLTVPISASSTAANIGTLFNAAITADMVVLESTVSNPSYQTSDWTVTTAAGSLTINGTASAATSVTLILGEV